MIIRDIIKGIKIKNFYGNDGSEISGISLDSQQIRDDYLFVAVRGEKTDGHKYIEAAVGNGAKAVILEKPPGKNFPGVSMIEVADSREALAGVSANFYGHPTKELSLTGITGTNGKTTVTYLLESIWRAESKNPGVIGTIDYRFGGRKLDASMTTPESLDLMRILREMRDSGTDSVAMEVSSHAIDKKRVLECHFDAAVFTNLTQDHLDYHGTIENYLNVKKKLFTEILYKSEKKDKFSIVNLDDQAGVDIAKEAPGELITYSIGNVNASVCAEESRITDCGIYARVRTPFGNLEINSKLFGEHNLANILAAISSALSTGSSVESVERAISGFSSVPGRLERVENPFGFRILVDYAHTPDALNNVLHAVKSLTPGRIILVFGCGGDRDTTKRPKMGIIGREHADVLIVTSDNPRTEPPEAIIDEIESGVLEVKADGRPYYRVADRKEAIRQAIELAEKNDTVLIAGKGHEDYQIIGTKKYPFDDRVIARETVREIIN